MDALLASAGPLKPQRHRSKPKAHLTIPRAPGQDPIDPSTHSIIHSTHIPSSYHHSNLATGSADPPILPDQKVFRIQNKKVRQKVARNDVSVKRAQQEREDVNQWLNAPLAGGTGGIEVDEDLEERTWRVKQRDIAAEVGVGSGRKKFDLKFEGLGSYKIDYTRNGRHLAIASSRGHVATFDWQAGKLHSEIQLREAVRDIKFLHSEAFYAVAQKKYVFIYDQNGVEVHKLKQHIDTTHMEFLPYHYLLATVGNAGHLKYHDTSTGVMLTQFPTRLGSPSSMAQNPHSAIIHLGHTNGTMTLWSPNMTDPYVKLLAHRGPITGIAVDPSERSAGRYVATSGLDGRVKIWDGRMWGKEVRSWAVRNAPTSLAYSGQGMLAVGGKSGVTVYRGLLSSPTSSPEPYLTLPLPSLTASSTRFCPFEDLLAIGHDKGMSSLFVPGSGEPNFDSAEADIYESRTRRREGEVRDVLNKIRPELITMDTDFLGKVRDDPLPISNDEQEARSFRQLTRIERLRQTGQADESDPEGEEGYVGGDVAAAKDAEAEGGEEVLKKREKRKMKGKGGSMKRFLKKQKKNVIDPSMLAMKAKVDRQRKAVEMQRKVESGEVVRETGALARFG